MLINADKEYRIQKNKHKYPYIFMFLASTTYFVKCSPMQMTVGEVG